MTLRFSVYCPLCTTGVGEAQDEGFNATSVQVVPCQACQEAYLVQSVTLRKTRAYELGINEPGPVRHRDGLVDLGG